RHGTRRRGGAGGDPAAVARRRWHAGSRRHRGAGQCDVQRDRDGCAELCRERSRDRGDAAARREARSEEQLMAFHATRFPLDIALGARGGPERMTDIVTLSSGREERNSRWAQSRRRYNAGYGVKSRADMQAVLAFFEERRGRFHSFLWRDGLDHSSGADTPTALDQAIGTGDGSTTTFQLSKTYGAAFDPYVRPITKP